MSRRESLHMSIFVALRAALVVVAVAVTVTVSVGLFGCNRRAAPERLAAVPWADGETSRYDMLDGHGKIIGTASWRMTRLTDGWSLGFTSKAQRYDLVLDAESRPRRSVWESGSSRVEVSYAADKIAFKTTGTDGKIAEKNLGRPIDAVDQDASLQVARAFPYAPGYVTRYTTIARQGVAVPLTVEVIGEEAVSVPAGTIASWHVRTRSASMAADAWYGKEAPHLLVRFRDPISGKGFALRSWRASSGGELHGSGDEPVLDAAPALPGPDTRILP